MRQIILFIKKAAWNIAADIWLNLATIGVIALALTLVSAFLMVAGNASRLVEQFAGHVEVSFYLKEGHTRDEVAVLSEELKADPVVASVVYVSKDQALARFREQLAELADVAASLDENPLPASIEVSLKSAFRELPDLERFAGRYGSAPGVEEVYYGKEWVERLGRIVRVLWIIGAAVGLFLAAAAVYIVATTIKLSIHRRREEIEVMRLVGATNRFIQIPFILVGVLQGLCGVGIALGALLAVHLFATAKITASPELFAPFFPGYSLVFLPPAQIVGMVLVGALLGLFGSLVSVGKFLNV